MKDNIKRFSLEELEREMSDLGIEPYRGRQIFQWLWPKNARSFDDMTNLSKDLRRSLKERFELINPEAEKVQTAADGTRKYRFKLEDGMRVESVFIPEGARRTICVSTQVGCALGCKFCATALMGFKRNLRAHEICGQVQAVSAENGGKPTNIVLMGMGEPLLNIEEVIKAVPILTSENGLGVSHRHVTVSTAGIVSGINRLRESGVRVKLAVSLNFADDKDRRVYMPIARSNPLSDLLAAARRYVTGQDRVTFEYVLIKGVNDGIRDAGRLAKLLQGMRAKINLIAFNPVPSLALESPDPERLKKFYEYMLVSRQPVTLRKSHGRDISAACGQLIGKRD